MKSPFYFITKSENGKRYDNTKEIGGIDFITSTLKQRKGFCDISYLNFIFELREVETIDRQTL